MMTVTITPKTLGGEIGAITSKSAAHRAMICSALADKSRKTTIEINGFSNDIITTAECLSALGAYVEKRETQVVVGGIDPVENAGLNCRDSGSTLRFLLPIMTAVCRGEITVTGEGRLPNRPLGELCRALEANGAAFSAQSLPLTVKKSPLKSGTFRLSGGISSQYVSGILFALPLLGGDSEIVLTSPLQSRAYVDMTVSMMRQFGIEIAEKPDGFFVKGSQKYNSPDVISTEGDWSNAAFFLAAGALGDSVKISGLDINSAQGDKAMLNILKQYGANVDVSGNAVTVSAGGRNAFEADVSEIPDLLPVLAVLGAYAKGETKLYNAARLRMKESDRLKTTAEMLTRLGADVAELSDSLIIRGKEELTGGTADSHNDHRIAMAAAIAAIGAEGTVTITDAGAVKKSYPDFFAEYEKLGGKFDVVNDRE